MNIGEIFLKTALAKDVKIVKKNIVTKGIFNSKIENACLFKVAFQDSFCTVSVSKSIATSLVSGDLLIIDNVNYYVSNITPDDDLVLIELSQDKIYA